MSDNQTPADVGEELAGFVSDVLLDNNDVGKRIIANRVLAVLSEWMPRPKPERDVVIPFTDGESKAFGREAMPFGKHSGAPIDEIPIEYLVWLSDNSISFWKSLHRYLNSPRIKAERENGDAIC